MFLKIADTSDEKDPIGRVKSVTQEQERTLAGMKSMSEPEAIELSAAVERLS